MTHLGRINKAVYDQMITYYLDGFEGGDIGPLFDTQMGFDGYDLEIEDAEDLRDFTIEEVIAAERRGVHPVKLVRF